MSIDSLAVDSVSLGIKTKASAIIKTQKASAYLIKLCRHFSHKVETKWDEASGEIQFSIGDCFLKADESALSVLCESPDDEQLEELMEVVKSHFDRFAIKDQLTISWS